MKHTTSGVRRLSAARSSVLGVLIACGVWLVGPSHWAVGQSSQTIAEGGALVRLPGHLSRLARPEYDMGEAAASLRMSGLQLILAKTTAQEEALKKLIADQQNPRSPQYHHWLTPKEFGARFGASDATVNALSVWLESHGLRVGTIPAGRDYLPFSGTKTQVELAFGTPIHAFSIKGEQHYSNIADPSIPASFKGAIAAIRGLNDFHPRPGVKVHQTTPTSAAPPQPDVYEGQIGSYGYLTPGYVGPGDAANIYDLSPLYANNITGKGVTVGVVAASDISAAQLSAYLTAFGVSQTGSFTSIPVPVADGGSDPGQTMDTKETEAYLDTEIIGGLAPGTNILLVRDKNVLLAAAYIVEEDFPAQGGSPAGATSGVGIINISFGACEAADASANTTINSMFQKAVTEGITITVSSGDAGADQVGGASTPGCMSQSDQGVQGDVASTGLAVNALASTPYTLSVGGTDFDPNLEGTAGGLYWSTTNTGPVLHSVAAHVPEMAWNSSCGNLEWSTYFAVASPLAFCNTANLNTVFGPLANPFIDILGGGGGVSSCTSLNAGACAGGYAQPPWQENVPGISNFGGRAVPDVSAIANRWVVCSYNDNPCNPVPAAGFPDIASGTSAAAPVIASIIALVDQSQQSPAAADGRQGLINPMLYQLAVLEYGSAANLSACNASQGSITSKACVFYDVTLGSNAQPCAVATFNDAGSAPASVCDTAGNGGYATGLMTAGSAVSPGSYAAGQGYDLATGLGSVNAANLVAAMSALAAPTGLTATTSGSSVTLKWNADASAATFNVYQGTAAGQEGATAVETGVTADTAIISGLQNAQTYYFEVAAVSAYGVSANSNEASAMTVPAAPKGVTVASQNTAGSLTVSWTASVGASSYSLFQGTTSGGEGNTAAKSGIAGTTATLTGLSAGQQYFFTVTATDAGGSSTPSTEASGTVIPTVPTGLSASAGNASITLSWSAATGATSYNVYQGTKSGGEGAAPVQSSISGTSATISGLTNATAYYFTVAAVDAGGTSAPSPEANATPVAPPPPSKGGGGSMDWLTLIGFGVLGAFRRTRSTPPSMGLGSYSISSGQEVSDY